MQLPEIWYAPVPTEGQAVVSADRFLEQLKTRLAGVSKRAAQQQGESRWKLQRGFLHNEGIELDIGSQVMVKHLGKREYAFSPCWEGPYIITRAVRRLKQFIVINRAI